METKPRILVIDDSATVRNVLTKQLEVFGAKVTLAEDGEKGWLEAIRTKYDLIIADIDMPKLNGIDLCHQLKDNPGTRGIPVIIVSSSDKDKDIDLGFKAGATAYVSKSEVHNQLNEVIEKVLTQSRFSRERCILLVDDSSTIRQIVSKALEEAGFQVMTAVNGVQALKRISEKRPDIIISDINMPEMDGIELCKRTHADPETAIIPFVMMSTISDRANMRRVLGWGASSYLVKPFNTEQVVITVERLLSDHYLILLKEKERLDSEQKMMLAGITSLIEALEARDPYTRGHSEAVAKLIARIGKQMNIDRETIESMTLAGKLHDIGKIGVPDTILMKPAKLTDEEFSIIKKHPLTGVSILGSIHSLQSLLPTILHHHERFDGKGYPSGLKGEAIMLWARITAVADTYHALISDRPYRKRLSHDEAIGIIKSVRGTQLCPDCVDTFLKLSPDEIKKLLG